jgi:hypothetical protein
LVTAIAATETIRVSVKRPRAAFGALTAYHFRGCLSNLRELMATEPTNLRIRLHELRALWAFFHSAHFGSFRSVSLHRGSDQEANQRTQEQRQKEYSTSATTLVVGVNTSGNW